MNISVIIPALNEEDNVLPLYQELTRTFQSWADLGSYEIIFVDDGSTDGTASNLDSIQDSRVKIIHLKKTAGQSLALREGFLLSRFELIATLDADLQHVPEDLVKMYATLKSGYDFVQGARKNRHDSPLRVFYSYVANGFRRMVLKDPFRDIACTLRLFKRDCISSIPIFNGAHRFLPFLVQKKGFKVIQMDILPRARDHGKTKYKTLNRLFKSLYDLWKVRRSVGPL